MTGRFGAPWGARVKISADLLGSSPMASQIRLANTTEHDAAGFESTRWRYTDQLVQTLEQCCVVPHPRGDRFDRGGR